jgi:hypothetical protein
MSWRALVSASLTFKCRMQDPFLRVFELTNRVNTSLTPVRSEADRVAVCPVSPSTPASAR